MNRVNIEIILGILLVIVTSVIILIYGFNEEERMENAELSQQARAIEEGAELFELQCSRCHGTQGTGIPGLCPPLNDRYFFDNRMEEIAWSGTLEDYIVSTASSGRLTSTRPGTYPGQGTPAMPSFATTFGGPLREDQIRNIAAYVMNWEATAELIEPPELPSGPLVGSDITKELPEGDPASGEQVAVTLGCTACHILAPTGPAWLPTEGEPGIGERAETRFTQPDYSGEASSAEQYMLESIVKPEVFLVSGYDNLMPLTYANTMSEQQAADLIAYMLSLK